MSRLAICPGSFDPITNGHVAIIRRSLHLFDRVLVAVSTNPSKTHRFTLAEREAMISACFPGEPRLQTAKLEGLLANWSHDRGAVAIVKGLRVAADFDYEIQMAHMNQHLQPQLETVFLAADPGTAHISSSLVKEVASLGGDIRDLVPPHVFDALHQP